MQNPGITELSYISGNEAFWLFISLIFQEVTFRAQKWKKSTLKMETSSLSLKKLLILFVVKKLNFLNKNTFL